MHGGGELSQTPLVEESDRISLPQKLLRDMIRQTLFAVSTDESRPILNGCYIKCEDQVVEMVAIDGFGWRSAAVKSARTCVRCRLSFPVKR
jgi:DNA polymerase III sliding clamp (beta) subunit (PCNA family)